MRVRCFLPVIALLVLGACGGPAVPGAGEVTAASAASGPAATGEGGDAQRAAASPDARAAAAGAGAGGRTGELVHPDEQTMVFLYHEIAGVAAPLEQWVEADSRVNFVSGAQKAARREQVRAELTAGLAGVRGVGFIRLTVNDSLSDYDAAYGEFTLRALAPSSILAFKALQQEVSLRFGNGRHAQVWSVPAAQAQQVQDSFRYGRDVVLDLLLKITAAQPATRGGTLVADVLEYEIRTQQGNQLLARVKPTPQ